MSWSTSLFGMNLELGAREQEILETSCRNHGETHRPNELRPTRPSSLLSVASVLSEAFLQLRANLSTTSPSPLNLSRGSPTQRIDGKPVIHKSHKVYHPTDHPVSSIYLPVDVGGFALAPLLVIYHPSIILYRQFTRYQ